MNVRIDASWADDCVEGSFKLPAHSLIARYLKSVACDSGDYDVQDVEFLKKYKSAKGAFITVATRTQGKRIAELAEVFLCLAAQRDRNFVICLIGHNLRDAERESIERLIDAQPDWLRDKVCFASVKGGSRSRPLNVAFALSETAYITFLDDDDVVFDNWIEVFHSGVQSSNGSILYSYVFTQDWEARRDSYNRKTLMAIGPPTSLYCQDYDSLEELCNNRCPIMGLAYPTFLFKSLGLRFDESLTTTEDWDFLVRSASFCGVVNTGEATSIYRLWKNAENSQSLHDKAEWDANRMIIQERLSKAPYLMPEGITDRMISLSGIDYGKVRFDGASGIKLGARVGDVWLDETKTPDCVSFIPYSQMNIVEFRDLASLGALSGISLTLRKAGLMTLSHVNMEVRLATGESLTYDMLDLFSFGFIYDDFETGEERIAFLRNNPHFDIDFKQKKHVIESIRFEFTYENGVHDRLMAGTRLMVRARQKLKRIKRSVSGRKRT